MLDVSWGEIFVVTGAAVALVGRRDLPRAAHFLGPRVGQIVGLLQGARARADRFATNNELRALQNELRSGLREIDSVKGELAIAASSRGLVGRGLARTVGNANASSQMNNFTGPGATQTPTSVSPIPQNAMKSKQMTQMSEAPTNTDFDYLAAAREAGEASVPDGKVLDQLAPRYQSVAAVAEEEWDKQGIGFKSRAEMGTGIFWGSDNQSLSEGKSMNSLGGSYILSDLIQQSLIHDQYDRVILEQDQILHAKVSKTKEKLQNSKEGKDGPYR
jgi:Sec-independent protein translocase protein TatA